MFLPTCVLGQEPYYQLPSERAASEAIFLPNLESQQVFWYLALNGGLKLGVFKGNTTGKDLYNVKDDGKTMWEAVVGFNKDTRWQIELGYQRLPHYTFASTDLSEYGYFGINLKSGEGQNVLLLRAKKRLLNLDRIANRTGLYLTSGLLFNMQHQKINTDEYFYRLPVGLNRTTLDTLDLLVEFNQKMPLLLPELGLEISGRLSDQLELGIYARSAYQPADYSTVHFKLDLNNRPISSAQYVNNNLSFYAGFQLRYNFIKTIKYASKL